MEKEQRIFEALQAVTARSDAMVEWALLVVAGSIAAIVSTSYIRPRLLLPRLIYLLFVPAWLSLAVSLYFGDQIARRHLAAHFVASERLSNISALINADFECQLDAFGVSLAIFGVWLIAFLLWWVFAHWAENSAKGD